MKRKLVFPIITLSSIFLSGCFFGTNSSKLVPTESITTTEETTIVITSAETTTETTVETYETTAETTVSEETTENTATSEESSATKGTTKATNKTPTKTQEKKTTKPASKSATKAPAKTTTNSTTKSTTKATSKESTKTTTKAPTKVPSKGYATVKFKVTSYVYVDDESDETKQKTDYFEIKCYTTKYHSKKLSDYKLVDKNAISDKVTGKYSNNLSNYSAKPVEIVKFTN